MAIAGQLRGVTDELRDLAPLVRRDEPDAVHQARIRVRRLRSQLVVFGDLFDARVVDALTSALRIMGKRLVG